MSSNCFFTVYAEEKKNRLVILLKKQETIQSKRIFPVLDKGKVTLVIDCNVITIVYFNYRSQLFTVLGNGITSRILPIPVIYITARSNPSPKPA